MYIHDSINTNQDVLFKQAARILTKTTGNSIKRVTVTLCAAAIATAFFAGRASATNIIFGGYDNDNNPVVGSFSYNPDAPIVSSEGNDDTGYLYYYNISNIKFKAGGSKLDDFDSNNYAVTSNRIPEGPNIIGIGNSRVSIGFDLTSTIQSFNDVLHVIEKPNPDYGSPNAYGTGSYFDQNGNFESNFLITAIASNPSPIVKDSVSVGVYNSGTQIVAAFTPNFDLTLEEAAELLGYKNFNWSQKVTIAPHSWWAANDTSKPLEPPFSDPPESGYYGQPFTAGAYPFYYSDNDLANAELPVEDVKIPIQRESTLTFGDSPHDSRLKPSEYYQFETRLVGVPTNNGSPEPLYEIIWTDNFNGVGTIDKQNLLSNLYPVDPYSGVGGISIIYSNDLSTDTTIHPTPTPEPSSSLLFSIGAGAFALLRGRNQKMKPSTPQP